MFFNPWAEVDVSRRHLPHWQQDAAIYFVTFRLADSIPRSRLKQWKEERESWLSINPEPWCADKAQEYEERFPMRLEEWLNAGYGSCVLADLRAIEIFRDALFYFNEQRYDLDEWVIMPNHIHCLLRLRSGEVLSKVLHSLKSFTAKEINRQLGREGQLWQSESYDRIVRGPEELGHFRNYIRQNPGNARVELPSDAFSWSSKDPR